MRMNFVALHALAETKFTQNSGVGFAKWSRAIFWQSQ
jgi:hypothetical protein